MSRLLKKHWKISLAFMVMMTAIVSLIALLAFGLTRDPRLIPSTLLNQPMPELNSSILYDTQKVSNLAEPRATVLNFWASWCLECRYEAEELKRISDEYQGRVVVHGVAIRDTKEDISEFVREYDKNYLISMDNNAGDAAIAYGLYGVPETFIIDSQGIVRKHFVGAVTYQELQSALLELDEF